MTLVSSRMMSSVMRQLSPFRHDNDPIIYPMTGFLICSRRNTNHIISDDRMLVELNLRRNRCSAMQGSMQYRKFAEECEQLARQAKLQRHREVLEEMSKVWRALAEEAEKKESSS